MQILMHMPVVIYSSIFQLSTVLILTSQNEWIKFIIILEILYEICYNL
jgi:hypothetical protein